MHITLDLRCNQAFINRRVVVCPGLAFVAEKVSSIERSQKSDLAPTSWMDDTNTIDG
jgi:hypothetical protein